MVTTIALGIVLGWVFLMLLPYIIGLVIFMVMLPFIAINWIYEKLTK